MMSDWKSLAVKGAISVAALLVATVGVASAYDAFARASQKTQRAATISALTAQYLAPKQNSAVSEGRNTKSMAATMLARRPLDSDPLTIAGLGAAIAGQSTRASPLLAEALRRDPRSVAARLWWLTAALKRNDISGALAQIDRLMALAERPADYYPILTELARQRGAEAPLRKVLAGNPRWRQEFVASLNASKVDSGLIFRLTGETGGQAGLQTALIERLIAKGDYDGAYLAWVNFLPESADAAVGPIYDGGFTGSPGAPPFNWVFNDGEAASVGVEKGKGLQLDYPAAVSVQMAKQVLAINPGQYRIDYIATGSGEVADGGTISIRVTCALGGAVLLDMPMTGLTDNPSHHAARFTVPEPCRLQQFSIEGTAGTFPKTRSVTIARVAIVALR